MDRKKSFRGLSVRTSDLKRSSSKRDAVVRLSDNGGDASPLIGRLGRLLESPNTPTLRQSASPTYAPSRTPTFDTKMNRPGHKLADLRKSLRDSASQGVALFSKSLSSDDEADNLFRRSIDRIREEKRELRKNMKAKRDPKEEESSFKKRRPSSLSVDTRGQSNANRQSIDLTSSGTLAGREWKIGPSGIAKTPAHFKGRDRVTRRAGGADERPAGRRPRYGSSANMACEFVILDEIGRGNSGVVFRAVHLPTLHIVALKRMRMQPRQRKEILQELQSLYSNMVPLDESIFRGHSAPRCPEIVAFHGAFTSAEEMTMSLVLEHMNAGTLQDFITSGRRLSEPALAGVAATILRGLAFIHDRRQIHRDIKPGNILINSAGQPKIADFGIAKNFDTLHLSRADTFTGTTIYMSPERLEGKPYTYAADIWSFGLTLFTLARGKFPFSTNGGFWALTQIIRDRPVPTLPTSEFSSSFSDFCAKCMSKNPAERPSAKDLLRHPFLAHRRTGASHLPVRMSRNAEREAVYVAKRVAKHYRKLFKSQQKRRQRRAMSAPSTSVATSLDGRLIPGDRNRSRGREQRGHRRSSMTLPRLDEASSSEAVESPNRRRAIRQRRMRDVTKDLQPLMRPSDRAVRHLARQLGVRPEIIVQVLNERLGEPLGPTSSSRRMRKSREDRGRGLRLPKI